MKTSRCHHWCLPHRGRFAVFLMASLSLGLTIPAPWHRLMAAGTELLVPPAGASIVARTPETHLVLRQPWANEPSRVKVEKTGQMLDPVVVMDDGEFEYLHFRLPLKPGKNSFIIVPEGRRVELSYRQLVADPNPSSLGKDAFLFHREEQLPESCTGCHDLLTTRTIGQVGLKKQTSCAICHANVVEKGSWLHSTTVNQQCLTCHQQSTVPWRIGFPSEVKEICLTCHSGKGDWFSRDFIHGPLSMGGCTLCHSPHGENYRYQLWAEGSTALCIVCHSEKENLVRSEKRLPYVHGIIGGQGCVACHDPHAADQEFMLRKPINQLCVGCHTGLAGVKRGHPVGGHPVSGPKERRRPGRKLTCVSCHDPHGSRFQSLLIGDRRKGLVCIACHR